MDKASQGTIVPKAVNFKGPIVGSFKEKEDKVVHLELRNFNGIFSGGITF